MLIKLKNAGSLKISISCEHIFCGLIVQAKPIKCPWWQFWKRGKCEVKKEDLMQALLQNESPHVLPIANVLYLYCKDDLFIIPWLGYSVISEA